MPLHSTIEEDPIQRVHLAVEALNTLVHQSIHDEHRPVLLLLSGTAEPAIFRSLDCLLPHNLAHGLTVSMLDERFSLSVQDNKYLQMTKLPSYEDAKDERVRFISTLPEGNESPGDLAERLHREFYDWRYAHRHGNIITTMGIGADGSTGGISPTLSQPEFEAQGSNLIKVGPHSRIIPTITFLTDYIDHAIVCTTEETEWALRELDKEAFKEELFTLPARVMYQMKDVHLFRPSALL